MTTTTDPAEVMAELAAIRNELRTVDARAKGLRERRVDLWRQGFMAGCTKRAMAGASGLTEAMVIRFTARKYRKAGDQEAAA